MADHRHSLEVVEQLDFVRVECSCGWFVNHLTPVICEFCHEPLSGHTESEARSCELDLEHRRAYEDDLMEGMRKPWDGPR